MPIVSIITVNFNNFKGLQDTIESVLNQTFNDYEYIIIDGGSTDASVDVIKKYGNHITYWISEHDNGIYNAMNKGIDKAKGNFVYFLNSGDIISKTSLQTVFSLGPEILAYNVIYGNIITRDSKLIIKSSAPERILYNLPFCHQAALSHSSLHRSFPFNEDYSVAADYEFFLKVFFKKYTFFQTGINFGEIDSGGISNTAFFKTMSEYAKILWRNSKGISRIYNPLNYIWHKKKFIAYLLFNQFLGPLTYRKLRNSLKNSEIN